MTERKATPERLGAFSDGVLAIIITIMVLDRKVPHESGLSYLFVGMVWMNPHLFRYMERAEPCVICISRRRR